MRKRERALKNVMCLRKGNVFRTFTSNRLVQYHYVLSKSREESRWLILFFKIENRLEETCDHCFPLQILIHLVLEMKKDYMLGLSLNVYMYKVQFICPHTVHKGGLVILCGPKSTASQYQGFFLLSKLSHRNNHTSNNSV